MPATLPVTTRVVTARVAAMSSKVYLFTGRILYKGEPNFTHLLGFEGAIGSAS
jgi:hypothetical protein